METLLNTSNPIIVLFYTTIAVAIIIIAKKNEISALPGGLLAFSIIILLIHVTKLDTPDLPEYIVSELYFCIAYDFILLLLSFISFLWIDDIIAKKKKLKSYDESLDWFWDKL